MNHDHNQRMQEVVYKGKLIKFMVKQFPGNEGHLTNIAENYFKTKKLEDCVI